MPFGLKNATQTFQRYIDAVFRDMDFVLIYIDDIIVISEDAEQHHRHLRQVFQRLKENSLSINISKCTLGQPEVKFLGYAINAQGYSPMKERVEKIMQYPKPETLMELRRFLGMINYYRQSIPQAAQLQVPLNAYLTRSIKNDKTKVNWTNEAEEAFEKAKQSLAAVTETSLPSPTAPLALTTDASTTAIGGVLEQLEHGIWRPIGFFSRKLSDTEQCYSTYDRELLAIFAAIKHFKHLLECRQFIIKSDHKPLTYAFRQKLSKASERQLRQLDYISQFSTDIVYVKGEENVVAGALSRLNAIDMPTILDAQTIQHNQQRDEELQDLIQNSSLKLQKLTIDANSKIYCDISSGIVRPYIPKSIRKIAFDTVHGLSHPSGRTTSRQLREKYIWPGIKKDAIQWSRECLACQCAKIHRHTKSVPRHVDIPDNRFNHIHIDIIMLPEVRGYKYCLTIIDRFSRWPAAVPLQNITADTITTALFDHWISHYGTPLTITSDQGSQFKSTLFEALTRFMGTKRQRTSPYHPQSNGLVERWHRTLKTALMCSPKPWLDIISTTLLGLRTSFKEDLQATPADMLYGTSLRIPGEFFVSQDLPADPQIFLEKHREYMRGLHPTPTAHHTKARIFVLKDINNCSHVFLRCDHVKAPLEPPYQGPFKVVQRITDRLYKIDVNGDHRNISIERLKPACVTKVDADNPLTSQGTLQETTSPHHWGSTVDKPLRTYQRSVTFKTGA